MHLNHISSQPPCLGCVNSVLSLCIWEGLPRKLQWAELWTWFLQSYMPPGSWQPTSWSLWSAAPSPQCPRKWIAKLWEPELRQQGRGINSVHISWWHLTEECRGPVLPADLLEQIGKNPQIEVLASLTTAASPARTDYKKPLKKPVTVGSCSSCVL